MILAISGSGRKNKMIHQAIKEIVKNIEDDVEIISLAGKRINGCIGCTLCAKDNQCKVKDDWLDIGKKMEKADIIIFGAPNYYGMINSLAHACLERTFSFRHQNAFLLKDKKGIIVTTSRQSQQLNPVHDTIQMFMKSNKMQVIGEVSVEGYDQCYTCGYGHTCTVGNVYKHHGLLPKIESHHLPLEICDQHGSLDQIHQIQNVINKALQEDRG